MIRIISVLWMAVSTACGFTATFVLTSPRIRPHGQHHTFLPSIHVDSAATDTSTASDRPHVTGVTLKIAVDSQGAVYDLDETKSERFTCSEALDMVHRLRCGSGAILVGRSTVQVDNPSLNVRRVPCNHQPLRVVLDSRLSLLQEKIREGKQYTIFSDGIPTVVYHCVEDVDEESIALPEEVNLVKLPALEKSQGSYVSPMAVLSHLSHKYHIDHLMIEGGPATAKLFLEAGLVDRVILIQATMVTFRKPLLADLTPQAFHDAGLVRAGSSSLGSDDVEYWTRSNMLWPTSDLEAWP